VAQWEQFTNSKKYMTTLQPKPVNFLVESMLLIFLVFLSFSVMCLYVLSSMLWLRVMISTLNRCSVCLFLLLFVEGFMSYLHYLCLFA